MTSSNTVIFRRSHALSPGAIAGAVIGGVLGGFILFLVLGFLYFRYRRKSRIAHAEEGLHVSKAPDAYHAAHVPWDGFPPSQSVDLGNGRARGVDYDGPGTGPGTGTVPVFRTDPGTQVSYGDAWMDNDQMHTHQDVGFESLPRDVDFSFPGRQQTFPVTVGQTVALPLGHATAAPEAANSSYYDTRISMDSDPVGAITPPSMLMNEMYRKQLKEAEEHRRSNSIPRRIWDAVMRRQSTNKSGGTIRTDSQSMPSQPQYGESPGEYPVPIKQEPGQTQPEGNAWQGLPIASHYVTEPEEISEDAAGSGAVSSIGPGREGDPQHKLSRGQTDDSQYGGFPYRIDSTIRGTTERDPALPSSVLNPDSTYGLPPEAQPQSPTEQRERLKSPEIPEPMDVDGLQPEDINHSSPFRSSNSPQLSPEPFTINPMAILHPTNPTEQAAYTTYQIKNSASPPPMPTPAPEIITQQPVHEDAVDTPPPKENDFADMYLDLPSDEEHRRSSDSYEYPTTPRQSSSSGNTPDTQPTISPLPSAADYNQSTSDPGIISPSSSKPSPQTGPLVCPECGREFDQIHKLNHHKRYHDRTHECTYAGCNRKFGTKTHLDRHINDRHLKLKTYHCTEPTCAWFRGGKSFPRKDNWRRHMVKKHGTTPQEFDNMEPS
ncbi:hypothetical protein GGS21DRAFT_521066 [Xylaria nigripes]|nr:hypothetical protein GGS21DRAFT_521066 [Xylaria nigripes]